MKASKKLLLLILVILLLGLSNETIEGKANSDIAYQFEKDILYNSDNIDLTNSNNLRNQTSYTEHYKGTYSFTDDGTHSAVNWTFGQNGGTVIVNSLTVNHKKVLDLNDITDAESVNAYTSFSDQTGTPYIEFWMLTNNISEYTWISFKDDGTHCVFIAFLQESIKYNDGSWKTIDDSISNNIWYHIKIKFNIGSNTFDLWLNNIKELTSAGLMNNYIDGIDQIFISTEGNGKDYRTFFDAFGFSVYNDYNIGDNLFPIIEISNLLEVSKDDFYLHGSNSYYLDGGDSPSDWKDYEGGGGDHVNIYNHKVFITGTGDNKVYGLYQENMDLSGNFINITFDFEITDYSDTDGYISIQAYSLSDLILDFMINKTGWYHYVDPDWVDLGFATIQTNVDYSFSIFINHELDMCFVSYTDENQVSDECTIKLLDLSSNGLGYIIFKEVTKSANNLYIKIDSIQILIDGFAETNLARGHLTVPIGSTWNYKHNNIITLIGTGFFSVGSVSGSFVAGGDYWEIFGVVGFYGHSVINCYDYYVSDNSDATLVLTIMYGNFSFLYLSIEGVKLAQGGNEYHLEYSWLGIDVHSNYFYVDDEHRLHFTLDCDTENLEYIQARFDIDNRYTKNYTIAFSSTLSGVGKGYFRVGYLQESTMIEFSPYTHSRNVMMPQDLMLHEFIILITDMDDDSILGGTTGKVYNIELVYWTDLSFTFLTLSLIEMIIPLIVLLVPTLAIYSKYGKDTIIPVFILMSIVCVASGLIPAWIFFIIAFSCGLFVFMKVKRDN